MENPASQFPTAQPQKKFPTGLVIGIVAIVLCCCCVIIVLAGLTIMGPLVSNVFSTINQDLGNPQIPEVPDFSEGTPLPGMPELPSDLIPQGGRGDEILRADTWGQVLLAAMLSDCATPNAAETVITVTSEPDASGAWQELWSVSCGAGETVPVEVDFTPSASGGTDISVTVAK